MFWIEISLRYVYRCLICNTSALVSIIICHRTYNKSSVWTNVDRDHRSHKNFVTRCCNELSLLTINTLTIVGPFWQHRLTLIPSWINYHNHYKEWDEIIYTFPNFIGALFYVSEWKNKFIPHFYCICVYASMLRLKLVHVIPTGHLYSQKMTRLVVFITHLQNTTHVKNRQ